MLPCFYSFGTSIPTAFINVLVVYTCTNTTINLHELGSYNFSNFSWPEWTLNRPISPYPHLENVYQYTFTYGECVKQPKNEKKAVSTSKDSKKEKK